MKSPNGTLFSRSSSSIVDRAGEQRHGATLVIDLNAGPISISGQQLAAPVDLTNETMLDLAKSLSKVDGALHIGADLHLHGFACLLDGRSIAGENRARGARFNSALRFTAEHEDLIVVVVSSDRPVSVIHRGVDLNARSRMEAPLADARSTAYPGRVADGLCGTRNRPECVRACLGLVRK